MTMMAVAAFAQNWRPLVEEGKTWELKTYFDEFPYNYDYVACISGDTIVDGQACKKFFTNGKLYAFLYEEGQKVYFRFSRNMNYWKLIYDFSLMPGDVVTDELGYTHEVERVDTITGATGEPFRRIIFKFVPHFNQPVWVSGIGGRQNLWDPWVYTSGDYCRLATCSVDGSLLFEGDEMMLGVVSGDRESGIVKIGGLKYRLDDERHEATLEMQNRWNGELRIPTTVEYGGQDYTIVGMKQHAFSGCRTLTRVALPSTISLPPSHSVINNPFASCERLEAVEVDDANPWLRSDDGVLLSADGSILYCYPAGKESSRYEVAGDITDIGSYAFSGCTSLKVVDVAESVQHVSQMAFKDCCLDSLIIRGLFANYYRSAFQDIDPSSVLYVQSSELESFQAVFPGKVFPLPSEAAGNRFSFRVVNPEGEPIAGALVVFPYRPELEGFTDEEGFYYGETHLSTYLNVGVSAPGYTAFFGLVYIQSSNDPITLIPAPSGAAQSEDEHLFSLKVVTQDGLPVPHAHVLVLDQPQMEGYTDDEGAYSVKHDYNGGFSLVITAPGYCSHYGSYSATGEGNTIVLIDKVCYKRDKIATIVLPVAPDTSWGRYYSPDRSEYHGKSLVFLRRVLEPQAGIPYIFIPHDDFELRIADYDRRCKLPETSAFPFGNAKKEPCELCGNYFDIETHFTENWDVFGIGENTECEKLWNWAPIRFSPLSAYFRFDILMSSLDLVFEDEELSVELMGQHNEQDALRLFDLQGRRVVGQPRAGVYIRDGRKTVVK